jgi:hypothetical protein
MRTKYERTYHFPWSPGTTSDDRFLETTEDLIGEEIVITEKLDGENSGITKGGVYARSHSAYTTNPWAEMVRNLHSSLSNSLNEDEFLFGENMEGIHSIEYKNLTSPFYLFNVAIRKDDVFYFQSWDTIIEYSKMLNLNVVPTLFKGTIHSEKELKELTLDILKNRSVLEPFDTKTKEPINMEGIVVRRTCEFKADDFKTYAAKWVRKNHVKTDEHWTRNWKRADIKWGY